MEFACEAGYELDPWQEQVLLESLGVNDDGSWAASEVAVVVPRQNGKGVILEVRELVGLFVFGERFIVHSAHLVDTSLEHFRRLLTVVEETPDLDAQVKKVSRTNGQESIELKSGCRIRFRTRSKGGGRGFSGDCLILDEAMFLPEFAFGALLPSLSAQERRQVWYAGSAVDQEVHEHGLVFTRVRERGIAGESKRLAFFEWSPDLDVTPAEVESETLADHDVWAAANPAFPDRISVEAVELEHEAMDTRTFAVERLGIGDWPRTDGQEETVIDPKDWLALLDAQSVMLDPVCLAFDVSPDRRSAIAAAGRREDGRLHVEIIDHDRGTGWLPRRLADLVSRHEIMMLVCDGFGPAKSVAKACSEAGIPVTTTDAGEMAQACGRLADLVDEKKLRHRGSEELVNAIRGAKARPLGDRWAWTRRSSATDISPLVAATLALWAAAEQPETGEVNIF